ncbi:short-chain dehydorgenase/reductase [Gordonia terrae C-6]|uniref:Short-chain dehydorgenase/reductase n=1 Tax=Gordonia terrae C-6 TaxID=1316928 RepID=R7Y9V6_9ACTN|nr:short-chain dehydorgenase/reductase [Gordonia terrae C-6]
MTRRWFITGGTPGGFGVAFAEAALEAGGRVVLTSRRPHELVTWAEQYGDRVLVVPLDVTDPAQVQRAVGAAEEHFGGIDVLINSAGRGWFGSIEGMDETTTSSTRRNSPPDSPTSRSRHTARASLNSSPRNQTSELVNVCADASVRYTNHVRLQPMWELRRSAERRSVGIAAGDASFYVILPDMSALAPSP